MPPIVRESIHWYHYGPIVGNELSDRRPSLAIISNGLNHDPTIPVVLTLPVTQFCAANSESQKP